MKMREGLVRKFSEAGLVLKISDKPLVGGSMARGIEDVFGLDIQRKVGGNSRDEWFRIYPGHEDNKIEVLGTKKAIGQLVFYVKEPKRTFSTRALKTMIGPGSKVKIVAQDSVDPEHYIWIEQTTPESKRHYLCGLDERQLFICQLPKPCTTVDEAHACLKAPSVTFFEGKAGGRTIRQGEWFFVNLTDAEEQALEEDIKKNRIVVRTKTSIGEMMGQRQGNPHTADEIVWRPEIYVRGKVRHKDHETVKFAKWRKVIRNAEANSGNMTAGGVNWID